MTNRIPNCPMHAPCGGGDYDVQYSTAALAGHDIYKAQGSGGPRILIESLLRILQTTLAKQQSYFKPKTRQQELTLTTKQWGIKLGGVFMPLQ